MHHNVLPTIKKESMFKLKTYLENTISSIGIFIGGRASLEWIRPACLTVRVKSEWRAYWVEKTKYLPGCHHLDPNPRLSRITSHATIYSPLVLLVPE
jgi:hypothetical protein